MWEGLGEGEGDVCGRGWVRGEGMCVGGAR